MDQYIGITIGPISDTMALAKTPAMLWYASSVFSRLSYVLCRELHATVTGAEILVPFVGDFRPGEEGYAKDGIGKYHDRIILKAEEYDDLETDIQTAIASAKNDVAEMVSRDRNRLQDKLKNDPDGEPKQEDIDFLLQYFQTPYVILEEEDCLDKDGNKTNVILAVSDYLDALEMMRTFEPDATRNVFSKLFGAERDIDNTARSGDRNSLIRECRMLKAVENSQLLRSAKRFRDIKSIAGSKGLQGEKKERHPKAYQYYAVVQADGDSMGEYLKTLTDDASIKEFSEHCIQYAAKVAEKVGQYGGMTIYAGGDDLLALAPVLHPDGRTVFDLCKEIGDCFDEIVKGKEGYPTVSIGVAVRYEKFPLYEALSAAAGNLFGVAKNADDKKKNYCAFDFQKHSGQEVKITVPAERLPDVSQMLRQNADAETVYSVVYNLNTFKKLFEEADLDEIAVKNVFENLYDNGAQAAYLPYVRGVADFYNAFRRWERKMDVFSAFDAEYPEDDPRYHAERDIRALEGLLRIKKFITEEEANV